MGHLSALATAEGLPLDAVQMEHRGSIARRMQCVHCKGITDNVTIGYANVGFTASDANLEEANGLHTVELPGVFPGPVPSLLDVDVPGMIV